MKLCLIFSLMAFGFNVSADIADKEMALKQINDELLYSIRDADTAIEQAQSGLLMSQVELCSEIERGLNSIEIAFLTDLKELKKVKVKNGEFVNEFLTLDDYDHAVSITSVSLPHIEKKLRKFSEKNCTQSYKEYRRFDK